MNRPPTAPRRHLHHITLAAIILSTASPSVPATNPNPTPKKPIELLYLTTKLPAKSTDLGRVQIPPCTPLRFTGRNNGRSKSVQIGNNRWGTVRVKRELIEAEPRPTGFADCVAAAPAYEARYTDEQVTTFLEGELAVGMPAEFALIALGPPRNRVERSETDTSVERYSWYFIDEMPDAPLVSKIRLSRLLSANSVSIVTSQADDRIAEIAVSEGHGAKLSRKRIDYNLALARFESGDHQAALEAWLELATGGYAPAQYVVADMYYQGVEIERNLELAVEWFGKAARAFYPRAMYQFGYLHARGEGVDRDLVEAYRWMERAAQFGDENSKVGAKVLEDQLTPEQLELAKRRSSEQSVTSPEVLKKVNPVYPERARMVRSGGRVILQAIIREDGTVHDIEVLGVDRANLGFEEAAIESLSEWLYRPATVDGEPTAVYFTVRFDFEIHSPN